MSYISLNFWLFVGIGAILYLNVPHKYQIYTLLGLNVIFYAAADIRCFVFLTFSITSTWIAGMLISRKKLKRIKKYILIGTITINIAILLFLKFYNYSIGLWNEYTNTFHLPYINVIVPLGISFYTLQAVSYCIDIYKRKISYEKNVIVYAAYMSYFPTIVQGPIVRYNDMKEQIKKHHPWDYDRVKFGVQLILYGVFKKLVVADRAALCVNDVFQNYNMYSKVWIVLGVVLYSIQIYADFSGCVDVCRGVSQILGIEIINNFNAPYFAVSIKDFWRRWHISFSSWLRDYVYIPLGGNRKGKIRKYINLLLTFLVSGIWHGVGIHYLVWGIIHGLYQVIGEVFAPIRKKTIKSLSINTEVFSYKLMQQICTFGLVSFAWIFFRANGMREVMQLFRAIMNNAWLMSFSAQQAFSEKDFFVLLVAIFIMFSISLLQQKMCIREKVAKQNLWFRWLIYFVGIFSILIFGVYGSGYSNETFIYMQF